MSKKQVKQVQIIKQRIEDVIRVKAFEIYQRDKVDNAERNWFQAIKELEGQ